MKTNTRNNDKGSHKKSKVNNGETENLESYGKVNTMRNLKRRNDSKLEE